MHLYFTQRLQIQAPVMWESSNRLLDSDMSKLTDMIHSKLSDPSNLRKFCLECLNLSSDEYGEIKKTNKGIYREVCVMQNKLSSASKQTYITPRLDTKDYALF